MGTYMKFGTNSSSNEVVKFLGKISANEKLGDYPVNIVCQSDIDLAEKEEDKALRYLIENLNLGQIKVNSLSEDDYEIVTSIFEALNKKFDMYYEITNSFLDESYFSIKQMERFTNHGELLSGKGSSAYAKANNLLRKKEKFSSQLKAVQLAGEDKEWYPTTKEIIEMVFWDSLNKNFWYGEENCSSADIEFEYTCKSFLDIGAGNGKFFQTMKELAVDNMQEEKLLFSFSSCYAIEQSNYLLSSLDKSVFVVGTDFFQSTLLDKKVDIIFTNPIYSKFSEWSVKTIKEANADVVYLVIPQRWIDDVSITEAIESRSATVSVLGSFSFEDAEDRKARAKVDLVKVVLREKHTHKDESDPFVLWFKETFKTDVKKEEDKYTTSFEAAEKESKRIKELVSGGNLVERLEQLYNKDMNHLMENYSSIASLDAEILEEIGANLSGLTASLKLKIEGKKNIYWQELFNNMSMITSRLSQLSRKNLLGTLTSHTSVDFTASNAHAIVVWAVKNANSYYDSQLLSLYKSLSKQENVSLYKSNTKWTDDLWRFNCNDVELAHYSLDYRIVDHHFDAIDSSYQAIDGMGPVCRTKLEDIIVIGKNLGFNITSSLSDFYFEAGKKNLFMMIESAKEEVFMEVKAFKNGNLHFKFNKKFMRSLNIEAARLNKWIKSPKEASEEFDISPAEAEELFGANFVLGSDNYASLLPAPKKEAISETKNSIVVSDASRAETPTLKTIRIQNTDVEVDFEVEGKFVIDAGDFVKYQGIWKEVIYSSRGILSVEHGSKDLMVLSTVADRLTGHKYTSIATHSIKTAPSLKDAVKVFHIKEHVARYIRNEPLHPIGQKIIESTPVNNTEEDEESIECGCYANGTLF